MSIVIDGLKYTKDHEWVKVEGNMATIGISDFAQHALGDIVYVELPDLGKEFKAGSTFAVIESVKAATDSYMPIGGKVTEINETIVDDPSLLNKDAYENWMIKVEITNMADLDVLMDSAAYTVFLGGE